MQSAKATWKVSKEKIDKNLLRVRGCGVFVQRFVAERELLQSTGHLVGQQREGPVYTTAVLSRSSTQQKRH